jgi:hypothetical protein
LSYLIGFGSVFGAMATQSVFLEIVSGINFLCGTVSLVGVAVLNQLTDIQRRLSESRP